MGDYRLVIECDKGTGIGLFDLKKDPAESKDLAETHPEIVDRLSKQLRDWQDNVMNSLMERDYKP